MFSLSIECNRNDKERLSADLYETGAQGILEEDLPENRSRLEAFFEDEVEVSLLADRFTEYGAVVRKQEASDWVELAQSQWLPILVGKRFFLVPAWRTDPVPPDRIRLEMPTGLAYGTGLDPTTQLALEAMERSLQPGDYVLDLGTGSGILSLGAKRLGAGGVVACDIDPQAAEVAEDFFRTAGEDIPVFVGSTRSLRGGYVDLLVANINAVTISELAAEITRLLKPSGKAVLTGFTRPESERIRKVFDAQSLSVRSALEKSGWLCLIVGAEG